MTTRREFLSTATLASSALILPGCASESGQAEYEGAVQSTWRHTTGESEGQAGLMRELVRYATLAPSSHNTQCWKFKLGQDSIALLPDFARRCPAVDPDDHHLFVSLGCATENLVQAASAKGYRARATFMAGASDVIEIGLEPTKAAASALFDAITQRQSTRVEFDGQPLSNAELKLLETAGTGNGVRVLLLTGKQIMENVLEYIVQGNTVQMRDPAFVRELKTWIRFNDAEAVRKGDGLFSRCTGNASVPRWLGDNLFGMFFKEKDENEKYARHVRSSAGIAVFVSEASDKSHWVEVGRAFERFALQATAIGVRNSHLNQPVEVTAIRPQLAEFLGITHGRPDLVVRFGRGPEMPRSLRRPVEAVLV